MNATIIDIPKNSAAISSMYQPFLITPKINRMIDARKTSRIAFSLPPKVGRESKSATSSLVWSNSYIGESCGFFLTLVAYNITVIVVSSTMQMYITIRNVIPDNSGSCAIPCAT